MHDFSSLIDDLQRLVTTLCWRCVSQLNVHPDHLGDLVKMQVLRWGLRFCISYRLPVDVEAADFPSARPFFPFSLPSLFLGISDTCSHLVDARIHHWVLLVSCGYLCSQNYLFKMKVWSCHLNFLKPFSVPRLHPHNMVWPTCLCSFILHHLCISSCGAPFMLPLMLMCLLSQGFGSCSSLYVTLSLPSHKHSSFTSQLPLEAALRFPI